MWQHGLADMLCNLYLEKNNQKIANISATTKAREKKTEHKFFSLSNLMKILIFV